MKKIIALILFACLVNLCYAQKSPLLAWGIPAEVCKTIGGDYDSLTELSEWNPVMKISINTREKLSGSITSGSHEILFNITGKKGLDSIYSVSTFSIKTKDNSFNIFIRQKKISEYQVKLKGNNLENTYVLNPSKITSTNLPKIIRGRQNNDSLIMAAHAFYLIPILSYKLGEAGITGNKYPMSLAIHRLGYSIANRKDIILSTISVANRLVPLAVNNNSNCSGRQVASVCEECWGKCGPKCECWDWACGDCCCHKGCLDHDAWCSCYGTAVCWVTAPTAPLNCKSCNVPSGDLPCSAPGCPSGGCPSGQFWCTYTRSCQPNGSSVCHPQCSVGQVYCERLRRCVTKGRCTQINECASSRNCPPESLCYRGRCVLY